MSRLGKLQKFYVGSNTTAVADKQKKRIAYTAGSGTKTIDQSELIKKFKPLWAKAIDAAIIDIKGHIVNQIKNDAFEKASRKIEYVNGLQNGLEAVQSGSSDVPRFIETAVSTAVLMAASYHYPEQTGEITKSYGRNYSAANNEGPQMLLKDITQGDTSKLGTILSFFKRALISG